MTRTPALGATILLLVALALPAQESEPVAAAAAAPVNGFPNWEERVLHQWINRARVEPAVDLAGCANCSDAELAPGCYPPRPPIVWDYELSVAARFHSESMARQGFFSHNTPCALRANLGDLYPGSCDGSEACACAGAGSTDPWSRASRFGASAFAEIIAAGYQNPSSAFYGWLYENAEPDAPCAHTSDNGHRWQILTQSGALGAGYGTGGSWGRYYTTDFGSGGAPSKVPSGVHYPREGDTVEFWANWYDDAAPDDARVVVGAISHPMARARGTATNGAWRATVSGLGSGCHRYYFEFTDASGQPVRHPDRGTFGVGPAATCADWVDTAAPPPALAASATAALDVAVSWGSTAGVTQYELQRSVGGLPFAPLATVSGTAYVDVAVTLATTYVYRVRPLGGSAWSNRDHATTMAFADDPLVAGATPVRAVHLTQMRTGVNALRDAAGLAAASWSGSPAAGPIDAAHVLELRAAVAPALSALGKSAAWTYAVGAGQPIRAIDLQEIRNALR